MHRSQEQQLVMRWRDLQACYNKIACALDRDLQDRFGIGLSEFETLDRLIESEEGKVRMHDLASAMYLSQSALSRAVARLERAGLVSRTTCADDRRAWFITATDAGRQRHADAAATHREVISSHLT